MTLDTTLVEAAKNQGKGSEPRLPTPISTSKCSLLAPTAWNFPISWDPRHQLRLVPASQVAANGSQRWLHFGYPQCLLWYPATSYRPPSNITALRLTSSFAASSADHHFRQPTLLVLTTCASELEAHSIGDNPLHASSHPWGPQSHGTHWVNPLFSCQDNEAASNDMT